MKSLILVFPQSLGIFKAFIHERRRLPYQNMTLEIYSATDEELKQLRSLIENAEPADLRTPGIYEILQEEAKTFFSGQKTAKEAAEVMQNRVSLYIRENG